MVEKEEDCGIWGGKAVEEEASCFPSAQGDRHLYARCCHRPGLRGSRKSAEFSAWD